MDTAWRGRNQKGETTKKGLIEDEDEDEDEKDIRG